MKRSPLRRKTELKRTPMPARRTWMKRVSDKRRKLMAKVKPFRQHYLASRLLCEVCLKRKPIEVHEITRGSAREASVGLEEVVLAVCRQCHDALGNHAIWSVTRQLALKFLRSPGVLDLRVVNSVRGRAQSAITLEDICVHLELKP